MADLCHDFSVKIKFPFADSGYDAIDSHEVPGASSVLPSLKVKNTFSLCYTGLTEIVPTNPLQRDLVAAKEHLFGFQTPDDRLLLGENCAGDNACQ
jgi:hypothetical protein